MNKKLNKTSPTKKRALKILQQLNLLIDKLKLDPIVETFRTNETLKDFYVKRIIEKIHDCLRDEKEEYIETLLSENENLKSAIQNQLTQINSLNNQSGDLNNLLNKKEKKIEEVNQLNEKLNLDLQEISRRLELLNTEYKNFKSTHDNIINENQMFREKIKLLDEDKFNNNQQISELNYTKNNLESEIRAKEELINFFKDNLNKMKNKQDEIGGTVDNIIRENENLKEELHEKNELNEELMNKIEDIKIEYEEKAKEFRIVKDNCVKLNEQIESVYKVKIKALKSKLKEKVEILINKEEEIKKLLLKNN